MRELKHCNQLTGKEWLQNSFSIYRIAKTKQEKDLKHPASYPVELCEKLIKTFTVDENALVLDPFNGIGSTMVACKRLGRDGIGIDLSSEFCDIAKERVNEEKENENKVSNIDILVGDSFEKIKDIEDNSIDFVLTSPPYWDILNSKRTADSDKDIKGYSEKDNDLGNISNYDDFVRKLKELFAIIYKKMKSGSYCIVNVMDLRKKSVFYPLHMNLTTALEEDGFILDDIIIWDRQQEYNNMKPLGYPCKFRINKVHEYLLIFIKE